MAKYTELDKIPEDDYQPKEEVKAASPYEQVQKAAQDVQEDDPVMKAKLKAKYEQYKADATKIGASGKGIASYDEYEKIQHILAHERVMGQKNAKPQQRPQPQARPAGMGAGGMSMEDIRKY